MELTLFSFGYHGWGSSVQLLLDATRAAEEARGYAPPCFVDLRALRGGRAAGFRERTFERLAGSDRYVWIQKLGNRRVADGDEGEAEIIDPRAAGELFDLAIERAHRKQRLIFFCHCRWLGNLDNPGCHRLLVTELLVKEARRRKMAMGIGEWPGGTPVALAIKVNGKDLSNLVSRGTSFKPPLRLAEVAGMPWGSRVTAQNGSEAFTFITGPGQPRRGDLVMQPLLYGFDDLDAEWRKAQKEYGLGWRTVAAGATRKAMAG